MKLATPPRKGTQNTFGREQRARQLLPSGEGGKSRLFDSPKGDRSGRPAPIDFVAFAKASGAEGFRCERPEEVRGAIQAALSSPGVAVVEAVVDAEEKPAKPNELKA
jgi:thiamine pyrophosphate-dependent acetolactate synthase large subunit-like protein